MRDEMMRWDEMVVDETDDDMMKNEINDI